MFRVAIPVSKRYHAHPMTQIDPEKEHQRLAARYAAMQDDELEKVALDFPSLTDVAKSALHSEMSRRHLTPPAEIAANHANEIAQSEARKPVMIRRYRDLPEASIAKSVVESAGIDCILADDNLVRLDWFYSNLVGGIKLLVPEKDADAAVQLLDESTPEKFAVEGVGEYEQPRCPKCGSMDVSLDGWNKPLTIAATHITSLPIAVTTTGWKCHSCRHQWNEGGEVGSAASSPGEQTN
jgi:Putative prokaryotic signal transducing protein